MSKQWQTETEALRNILVECGLTEEVKWRQPCFTFDGHNIAIIQGFKENCALMFFKGALLKDPKGLLQAPGENSQSARRFEFSDLKEITKLKSTIKSTIKEALAIEKSGAKIEKKEVELVEELQKALKKNASLKKAFAALTPGRQRAYNLFIASAKQSATREARILKCTPQILKGKGLND